MFIYQPGSPVKIRNGSKGVIEGVVCDDNGIVCGDKRSIDPSMQVRAENGEVKIIPLSMLEPAEA